jgi:hypothetical protein
VGSGLPTSLFASSFSVDGKVTELIGNNGRATLDPLLLRGAYTRVRNLGDIRLIEPFSRGNRAIPTHMQHTRRARGHEIGTRVLGGAIVHPATTASHN